MGRNRSAQKQLEPANFAEASPPNWISIRISRRFADCDRHSSGLYSEIKPSPPPPPPPSPRRPMQMQGRGAGRKREGRGETRFGNLCQTRGEGLDEFRICAGIRKPTSTSANERRTNPVNFCRWCLFAESNGGTATGLVVRRELIHRFRVPNLYGSSTRFEARRTPFDSTLRNSSRNPAGSEFSS